MRAEEAVLFLVVAVLSLALVVAVVAPLLRQKRSNDRAEARAALRVVAVGGPVCPTCHCQLSVGFRFCPFDGTALAPAVAEASAASDLLATGDREGRPAAGARRICPTCARRYRTDVSVCERDGAPLVPVN